MTPHDLRRVTRIFTVVVAIGIAILSLSMDTNTVSKGFDVLGWLTAQIFGTAAHTDKVAHFVAYAVLGFLALLGFRRVVGFVLVLMAIVGYGAALEVLQGFLPVRAASPLDFLANSLGAALGVTAAMIVRFLLLGPRS